MYMDTPGKDQTGVHDLHLPPRLLTYALPPNTNHLPDRGTTEWTNKTRQRENINRPQKVDDCEEKNENEKTVISI